MNTQEWYLIYIHILSTVHADGRNIMNRNSSVNSLNETTEIEKKKKIFNERKISFYLKHPASPRYLFKLEIQIRSPKQETVSLAERENRVDNLLHKSRYKNFTLKNCELHHLNRMSTEACSATLYSNSSQQQLLCTI